MSCVPGANSGPKAANMPFSRQVAPSPRQLEPLGSSGSIFLCCYCSCSWCSQASLMRPVFLFAGSLRSRGSQVCREHCLAVSVPLPVRPSPLSSPCSLPESPALCRTVNGACVFCGSLPRPLLLCLSFSQGDHWVRASSLTSECQVPWSVPVALAVGSQQAHVAFEFPSSLTNLLELPL